MNVRKNKSCLPQVYGPVGNNENIDNINNTNKNND